MDKKKVGIVYHFFAHYRTPIIQELITNGQYHYIFIGDVSDPAKSGIEASVIESDRFIQTHSRFFGKFLIQTGIIKLAFNKDFSTLIYLGDAQFLITWISAGLARLSGKRVLFWSHGWPRVEKGIKDKVRCLFYSLGHGMVLYNNRSKALGVSKGFNPQNLYVIYNSLDYDTQKKLREKISTQDIFRLRYKLFRNSNRPVLICTGRLVRYRRLELLIDAMGLLQKESYCVNLILVGEGPESSNLLEMAKKNGVSDSILFYGACYDEYKLASMIMAANVTVIPGQVGLTAIHSLGYGTPVISNDNPNDQGPEWEVIKPGVTGDLYRYGDIVDLARVIRVWTREVFVNEKISTSCYAVIEKYYHPTYQRLVMDQAVSGVPAQDEKWKKWRSMVMQ